MKGKRHATEQKVRILREADGGKARRRMRVLCNFARQPEQLAEKWETEPSWWLD